MTTIVAMITMVIMVITFADRLAEMLGPWILGADVMIICIIYIYIYIYITCICICICIHVYIYICIEREI